MGSHPSDGEPGPLHSLSSARAREKMTGAQRCDILIGRHTSVGNGGASPSGGPRRCGDVADERLWPGACLDSVLNGGTRDDGREPSGSLKASSG